MIMVLKKRMFKFFLIILIIIGIIAGGKAVLFKLNKKEVSATAVEKKISVTIQKTRNTEIIPKLSYKATIEPIETGVVCSKMSGRITQIMFVNGDYVEKGASLVTLDDQESRNQLKSAQNQLRVAQNQLEILKPTLQKVEVNSSIAKRNFERLTERYKSIEISKEELEKSQDALEVAKLDYQSAITNYETIRLNIETININIDNIKDSIENAIIRAPISGIIDEKSVNIGQYITIQGSTTIIAKVKNISSVDAVIQIQQEDLPFIKEGKTASVRFIEENGKVFQGVVKNIDASANPQGRNFNCKIEVNNDEKILRPGVFVKVEVNKDEKKQVAVIPVQALAGSEGNYFVFVAEDGVARKRNITIGETMKDNVEIKSGLKNEESVITSNLSVLQDGDKISIKEAQGG